MPTPITGAVARRGAQGLIGPARRLRAGRGRPAVARAGLAVAVSAALTLAGSAGPALATASSHAHPVTGTGPGSGWSMTPTPNLPTRTGQLIGVSCASSSSCTAVGDFTTGSNVVVTLAQHWDGGKWASQPTPNVPGARLSALIGASCSAPSACTAVGQAVSNQGASAPLAERWNGTRWRIQATPNPVAGGGALFGVACASSSACTAVGASNSGTLAEHWNGTRWSIQATPNPSAGGGFLASVACTSSSACTAVGSSNSGTLAEHWNGTRWRIQATPNPSGAQFSFLNAVSCTSSSACSAVGGYGNSSGTLVNLAERWNGTTWQIQRTPNRPRASASGFSAISCPMPSFCMAAGPAANSFSTPVSLAESWNGKSWKVQDTPNLPGAEPSGLLGVSCTRPSNCMAVGLTGTDNSPRAALVAEHWNGNSWNITPVPNPPGITAGGGLGSVSCTGTSACMAIGAYSNSSSPFQPLSERWNGTRWSVVPIPHPPGALATLLQSVACTSATACTTVGFAINASGTAVTVAERWNGTRWSNQPTPNPAGTPGAQLLGVACTGASACTAVGAAVDSAGDPVGPALAERWNGTRWSIQPAPNPSSPGGGTLNWVACPSRTACEAVGASVDTSGNPLATLAERWNGTRWSIQPTPNPAGVQGVRLEGVACTSPSACTAVGGSFANASLAERWNGTKWAIQASPNPAGPIGDQMLWSVACSRPLHCMAVGKYASFAPQLTLAERWNGSSENAQPAAKVSKIPSALGLACSRMQRLSMKGFGAATSSAASFGVGRGPSTRPAWMAFLP